MFDTKDFELSNSINMSKRKKENGNFKNKQTGKFIKGPISLSWIIGAINLSPCAIRVGLVLWYLKGLRKSSTVILSTKMLKEFNLNRSTKYRGLKLLEEAGLVEVNRRFKKNPAVTIKNSNFTAEK